MKKVCMEFSVQNKLKVFINVYTIIVQMNVKRCQKEQGLNSFPLL